MCADARWLIATGLLCVAAACYWMALMNLEVSPWQVAWPRVLLIVGLSMIFAPLNVAAVLAVALVLLVPLMKRSVAEKGPISPPNSGASTRLPRR